MKFLLLFLILCCGPLFAEVKLPVIFSDGMVLQRDSEAAIWGMAEAGSEVSVHFAGQNISAKADADGAWRVVLKGLKMSKEGRDLVIKNEGDQSVIHDVLVGEVWLGSGQSNMEWVLPRTDGGDEEVASAKDDLLRVFVSVNLTAVEPQWNWKGSWKSTKPENSGRFTAVGYYFAKKLRKELDVPVGIVECAWGGKPIEAFISEEAIVSVPVGKEMLQKKKRLAAQFDAVKSKKNYEAGRKVYLEKLAAWEKGGKKGKKPRGPGKPVDPATSPRLPATIYHGMIAPIVGYGNRGVIWYQGESNANGGTGDYYEELLGCLVADWRARWGSEMSFYWVQLANYGKARSEAGWVTVQDEMRRALKSIPKSGMAVINDIGATDNIHPGNKVDVGERLARWALAQDYGMKEVVVSGPLYSGFATKGEKVVLSFDYAKGLKSRDQAPLKRFEIAGKDDVWKQAEAKVVGEAVEVWSDEVKQPVKVRYAWAQNPTGANLVNAEGLPASCFTTE